MAGDMRIAVTVSAIDRLSAPMKAMAAQMGQFEKNLRAARKSSEDFGAKWSETLKTTKAVGVGLTAAGGAALFLGKSAVQASMEMETMGAKMRTAMKDTAKAAEMMAWAKAKAAQTPFEMKDVVDATVRMQMYGMEAKKSFDLVGNMAGAMGRSVQDAVEAVADAQRGEFERLKEFGGSSYQLLQFGAMKRGPGVAAQTGEEQAALKKALEGWMAARFGGGMALQAETTTGKLSNLSDAIYRIRAAFGDALAPTIKSLAMWLTTVAEKAEAFAKSPLGQAVAKWATAFGALALAIGPLLIALPSLITGATMAWAAFTNPIGIAVAGVALLVAGIATMIVKTKEAGKVFADAAKGGKFAQELGGARTRERAAASAAGEDGSPEAKKRAADALTERLTVQAEQARKLRDALRWGQMLAKLALKFSEAERYRQAADAQEKHLDELLRRIAESKRLSEELGKAIPTAAAEAPPGPQPLSKQQTEYNDALKAQADAQKDLTDAVTDAADKRTKALQALRDAEEAQAEAARESAGRIAQAKRSLSDAYEAELDLVEQVDRRIVDAEDALTKAQEDRTSKVADAERALVDARQDAADAYQKALNAETDAAEKWQRAQQDAADKVADAYRSTAEKIAGAQEKLRAVQERMQEFVATGGGQRQLTKQERMAKEWRDLQRDLTKARGELAAAQADRPGKIGRAEEAARRSLDDAYNQSGDSIASAWKGADQARDRLSKSERSLAETRKSTDEAVNRADLALSDAVREGQKQLDKAARDIGDAQKAVSDAYREADKATRQHSRSVTEAHKALTQAGIDGADAVRAATEKANEAIDKLNAAIYAIQPGATGHTGMPYQDPTLQNGPVPRLTVPGLQGAMDAFQAAASTVPALVPSGLSDYGLAPTLPPIVPPAIPVPAMQTVGAGASGGSMRLDIGLEDGLFARQTGAYLQSPDGQQIVVRIVRGYGARQTAGSASY